jgi:hypothetical protein
VYVNPHTPVDIDNSLLLSKILHVQFYLSFVFLCSVTFVEAKENFCFEYRITLIIVSSVLVLQQFEFVSMLICSSPLSLDIDYS